MADTPEERKPLTRAEFDEAYRWLEYLTTLYRDGYVDAAVENLAIGTEMAEARGFAKGLEVAALECVSMYEATPSVPSNLRLATAAARIRALAPQAPPEVAAAEPKP